VTSHPPPNASNPTGETEKKRKREAGKNNDHVLSNILCARFPNLLHINKHLVTVHKNAKKKNAKKGV